LRSLAQVAPIPGAPLRAGRSGQQRPANQYVVIDEFRAYVCPG